jgi:hypothetical protein
MLKGILIALVMVVGLALGGVYLLGTGIRGDSGDRGEITQTARPAGDVTRVRTAVKSAASEIGVPKPKQVLFGDLHVHTTFSFDAFMLSLPAAVGEGAHPPADACDFARFCSQLDFWSINDHAEQISSKHWDETIESIRQCNDVAGPAQNPDMVSFLGWEWTQVGATPDDHYGHKNVVVRGTADGEIPERPIAAGSVVRLAREVVPGPLTLGALALVGGHPRYDDLAAYFAERRDMDLCDPETNVHDLPDDCLEYADTPADLFRKLDEWQDVDSIVVPHGTTWGFYTPTGSTWEKQLSGDMHDEDRQTLFEIYSGHGDSEAYRSWRAVELDAEGAARCPEPRADYLPSCWRAGQIIRERCNAEGLPAEECEAREVEARENAAAALGQGHLTVQGTEADEWLDAGQCKDCREPAFNYRPGGSAQYVTALSNFEGDGEPRRFRFGFMSSSDNHFGRPGTGYKEVHRRGFTESNAPGGGPIASFTGVPEMPPISRSVPFDRATTDLLGFQLFEFERQTSFFMTGGLIAAHATGRDRDSIWEAFDRREVYGTSGPRLLLWFDLLNPPGSRGATVPMGGEVEMSESPIFQVRAVGSFRQKPGCPSFSEESLGAERLEHVCKGECYNPSNERNPITRIEIVRIRPQTHPDEDPATLIDDPWRRLECDGDPTGCVATFTDPEFASGGRDAVYYARAFEPARDGINSGGLRCEYDDSGNCTEVNACPGAQGHEDDCLAKEEPRAWSSPIFVDHAQREQRSAR